MGKTTKIGWTHHTFNPWRGCTHGAFPEGTDNAGEPHPGCLNCYAEFLVCEKFQMGGVKGEWGPGAPRTVAADSGWAEPLKWARAAAEAGERRRVFFSLGDPLDEEAPREAQERFWQLIRDTARLCSAPAGECPDGHDGQDGDCPHCGRPAGGLDWLLLTKRPWRWRIIPEDVRALVWLGTSISDQATADAWVPELLKAEGFRLLFISAEPLIGEIDLDCGQCPNHGRKFVVPDDALGERCAECAADGWSGELEHGVWLDPLNGGIEWVITGGESGGDRRDALVKWYQKMADQCADAGVAFYMKQDTAFRAGQQGRIPDELWSIKQVPEVRRAA